MGIEDMLLHLDWYDYGHATTNNSNEEVLEEFDEISSNLQNIPAKEGMRLEIRDIDYVWSSAIIHKYDTIKNIVTIRYDGWGNTFNEILPYPHPRLCKIYTFTKEIKVLVDLSTILVNSADKNNLWPCK